MIRKARAGHVTGGRVFGYDNVEVLWTTGKRSHVERRINENATRPRVSRGVAGGVTQFARTVSNQIWAMITLCRNLTVNRCRG
jgi:hypothetical protein